VSGSGELLPCPFPCCMSARTSVQLLHDVGGQLHYAGWCQDCAATGPEKHTQAEAAAAWNRRSSCVQGSVELPFKLPVRVVTSPFAGRLYIKDADHNIYGDHAAGVAVAFVRAVNAHYGERRASPVASPDEVSISRETAKKALMRIEFNWPTADSVEIAELRTALQGREKT
jgi:hypothetical protein